MHALGIREQIMIDVNGNKYKFKTAMTNIIKEVQVSH